MTTFLMYLLGFFISAVISYLIKMKDVRITIGDLVSICVISLGSWATITFYLLAGLASVINSLPFDWLDIDVLSDEPTEL